MPAIILLKLDQSQSTGCTARIAPSTGHLCRMLVPHSEPPAIDAKCSNGMLPPGAAKPGKAVTDNAPGQTSTSDGATGSSSTHSATAVGATRKREKKPDIDYDAKIQEAAASIKEMSKAMAAAKSAQKNERRKKQRLLKKAACLSPEDLERIAVLKRCGLWSTDTPQLPDTQAACISAMTKASKDVGASSSSAKGGTKSDGRVPAREKNQEEDGEGQSDEDMPGTD
jgi:hypothetical protein